MVSKMGVEFISFVKKLFILTIILALVSYLTFLLVPLPQMIVLYYILGFFLIITGVIHYFLLKASEKNPRRFPAYYMGGITLKLFVSLIFIVIYAISDRENAKFFLLAFFIIYLIYTTFETVFILKHLNPGKKD